MYFEVVIRSAKVKEQLFKNHTIVVETLQILRASEANVTKSFIFQASETVPPKNHSWQGDRRGRTSHGTIPTYIIFLCQIHHVFLKMPRDGK